NLGFVAQVLVELGRVVVEIVEREVRRKAVVISPRVSGGGRRVRAEVVLEESPCHRVNAISRNGVCGRRLADPLVPLEASGVRIINRDETPLRIAQVAEVAAQLRLIRYR